MRIVLGAALTPGERQVRQLTYKTEWKPWITTSQCAVFIHSCQLPSTANNVSVQITVKYDGGGSRVFTDEVNIVDGEADHATRVENCDEINWTATEVYVVWG